MKPPVKPYQTRIKPYKNHTSPYKTHLKPAHVHVYLHGPRDPRRGHRASCRVTHSPQELAVAAVHVSVDHGGGVVYYMFIYIDI